MVTAMATHGRISDVHRPAPAEMRLTAGQRRKVDKWLAANMGDRKHTCTWAANQLAPTLGLGEPPLPWETLHPLSGAVRARCRALGIKPKNLNRADRERFTDGAVG